MSSTVIALLFLACGWKLYKDAIYTRYLALRNAGHPQYFGGALCAVLIFAISHSLDSVFREFRWYVDLFDILLVRIPYFGSEGERSELRAFVQIFLWAIPATYATIRLLNIPFHKSPSLLLAAAKKTRIVDELEETIYFSLKAHPKLSIAVTTKQRKVYVGVPKRHSPDPDRDRVWLAIWPLASGYRNENGELSLTTFYDEVIDGTSGHNRLSNYQVVIPLSEVAYAQAFDLPAYAAYQQAKSATNHCGLILPDTGETNGPASSATALDGDQSKPTHHSSVFRLTNSIVNYRERYVLRMYAYYCCLLVFSILVAPYRHPAFSLASLAVAIVAGIESVEPILIRIARASWFQRPALQSKSNTHM